MIRRYALPRLQFAITSAAVLVAALLLIAYFMRMIPRQASALAVGSTAETAAGATASVGGIEVLPQ
jgi:hypothetical protein